MHPAASATARLSLRPAVFVDRDGTINEQVGYTQQPEQIRLIPGAAQAVALFNELGFLVVMVTNQSSIARGLASEEQVARCCAEVSRLVAVEAGGKFDAVYWCPFHPDYPKPEYAAFGDWRKPKPGMFLAAAADFHVDFAHSWLVGDGEIDHQAAKAADGRIRTIVLPSTYHDGECGADYYAPTLWEAAQLIARESGRNGIAAGKQARCGV